MPETHAKLTCSGAARWLGCPGSVKLSECYPQAGSIYTAEGSLAHLYLEKSVKGDTGGMADALAKADEFYGKHPDLDGSADAMRDTIDEMMSWIATLYEAEKKEDPAAQIFSEQRVDLSAYIPGGFGTTDVTIARTGRLHIIDLKYGKGVAVDAKDNPQLRLYALGMLEMLDMVFDVDDVQMTIYQPRIGNVSTDGISADDLRAWGEDVIRPAAKLALSDDAPLAAGDWCRFCPARRACRVLAGYNLSLEKYKKKLTLSPDEIAAILDRIDGLVRWADDLKAGALETIQEGGEVPGWKVVAGRSIRRFRGDVPEKDIVAAAEGAGYAKPMLYETKMLSLSQIEKVMGKKAFAAALGGYVERPEGKPTLAPESDKRPSLYGQKARDVFADEIDGAEIPFV